MNRPTRRAALASFTLALGATATAVHAQAQFQPSIYGVLDAGASRTRAPGGRYQWLGDSGSLSTSYIGFKGSEDLGGGLRAKFQLESYVRLDTGTSGRSDGDRFWSRDSFVGLQGAFGSTVLGRNPTPLYSATIAFNPFADSFGFSPSTRQYYGSNGAVLGDRSWTNSISYTSNYADGPLHWNLAANAGEGSPGATGRNLGGTVSYVNGPLALSAGGQRLRNSTQALPVGFNHQDAYQLGATYDLTVVRLFGQFGRATTHATVGVKTNLYQFGGAIPVGAGTILVAYGHSNSKRTGLNSTDQTVSIAYDYNFSKNTDVYIAALNEKVTSLTSGRSVATGLRVRF